MTALEAQLERLGRSSRLLVGMDYDGVVAPIVADPARAYPLEGMVECLVELAGLRQTDVAIISGRAVADLRRFLGSAPGCRLVGSHGAEWPDGSVPLHDEAAAGTLRVLCERLEALAREFPGVRLEHKPAGVAVHYREVDEKFHSPLLGRVEILAAGVETNPSIPRLTRRVGKMVVEYASSSANKGDALRRLRHLVGATGVVCFGDDVTDEDMFRALGEWDAGVAVGGPREGAAYEVGSPGEVLGRLRRLIELRRSWADSLCVRRIERHSILSDQRAIALVDDQGTIGWSCLPRIDGPAFFSSILGARMGPTPGELRTAGEYSIRPAADGAVARQEYAGDSLVLKTRWPEFTVTDYFDCSAGRPYQRAGRCDLVRVLEGRGRARIVFAPRMDFGRVSTTLRVREEGLVIEGQPDPMVLVAGGIKWDIIPDGPHHTARAEVELGLRPLVLELRYGSGSFRAGMIPEPERRDQTRRFWGSWAGTLRLPSVESDLVKRSALTIKALVHGPSGAICAAGTTSLPEWPGGVRNWDYRFCWPRDAALAAGALVRLGNIGHAMRLLDWFLGIVDHAGSPERMRPIYTVTGHDLGAEAEITDLQGYAASRPVRVGNAAAQQVQLDVFGPIVDLVWMLAERGAPLSADHWRLVDAMVTAVERRWHEPDNGIWEIRGPRQHCVHSKVMCWMAVDRAVRLAETLLGQGRPGWEALRDRIREDVLTRGWDPHAGAFTLAYDVRELDAACLHVGLSGLLPASDERFRSTVEAVDRRLRHGTAVYRYRFDDGLPGFEGGFLICLGWLIESLLMLGRRDQAEELFARLAACAGPTGMLAEEVDPETGAGLGNVPQAYSHLAVINAAIALDRSS